MPPEATRLFDVALPLLERSAPDRLTFSHSWHSGVMGVVGMVGVVMGGVVQLPVPNAIARSLSSVDDDEGLSA